MPGSQLKIICNSFFFRYIGRRRQKRQTNKAKLYYIGSAKVGRYIESIRIKMTHISYVNCGSTHGSIILEDVFIFLYQFFANVVV